MKYFRYKSKDTITCLLCKHYCNIKEGKTGICGVNQNKNNNLINLVYNHPSALNVDPIEKKPLYHFLPSSTSFSIGTVGCNFRCLFCQNYEISQTNKFNSQITYTPNDIVNLALKHQTSSISYTYNEPTIWYPYAKDIGIIAKQNGLKNIFVSSGYESKEVLEDMLFWLDGANIDLKSFNKTYYKKVLKTSLDGVLDSLIFFAKSSIHLEITTLIIEGINDSENELKNMAKFIINELGDETIWHLSAFYPNYKMQSHPPTTLKTLLKAKEIAMKQGLKFIYLGNTKYDNSTYCPNCHELLIKREFYQTKIEKFDIKTSKCKKCNKVIKGVWI
jgi:pyruvate formate lyase activating enzyme